MLVSYHNSESLWIATRRKETSTYCVNTPIHSFVLPFGVGFTGSLPCCGRIERYSTLDFFLIRNFQNFALFQSRDNGLIWLKPLHTLKGRNHLNADWLIL